VKGDGALPDNEEDVRVHPTSLSEGGPIRMSPPSLSSCRDEAEECTGKTYPEVKGDGPMGKGDDTKVQGSPPPNRPKRASSLPHLLTNPRATPVKTVEKRENWQKAMKLNGFVLEEILGHEVCAEATGGYKILTKWPSNPPTKAGVTEWYLVKTI
jgi:hypothetical protein